MTQTAAAVPSPLWRFVAIFVVAGAVMLGLFQFAEWRAENTLLTRYCDQPQAYIDRAVRILEQANPVEDGARRAYIIAAKLLFLIPQHEGEDAANYRQRLTAEIRAACQ